MKFPHILTKPAAISENVRNGNEAAVQTTFGLATNYAAAVLNPTTR